MVGRARKIGSLTDDLAIDNGDFPVAKLANYKMTRNCSNLLGTSVVLTRYAKKGFLDPCIIDELSI